MCAIEDLPERVRLPVQDFEDGAGEDVLPQHPPEFLRGERVPPGDGLHDPRHGAVVAVRVGDGHELLRVRERQRVVDPGLFDELVGALHYMIDGELPLGDALSTVGELLEGNA
jgi:hypothetical protein